MSDFLGVWGVADPGQALRGQGVVPVWEDDTVAFGGAPVWTDAAGNIVVCGDLHLDNAPELRERLGGAPAEPGVLLAETFGCHGRQAGSLAQGMFALAVWDRRARQMTLLRDGVGARTLYYAVQGRTCWFGARLAGLRRCPIVSAALSPTALRHYLICAFVPGCETLWQDVRELTPGTALVWPDNRLHVIWEPSETAWDPDEPAAAHAARLRPLLEDAVQVRLPQTGSVGVFLSGGLDSSLVTALACRQAAAPVHTFAIHFGREYPNELAFSSLMARHCGTRHHVLELPARRIKETLFETLAVLDNPIGDPLTTPNLLLGRAAAAEVGTVLNGEGGDPCFGGPKNLPMLLHALYESEGAFETAYLRAFGKCLDDLPRLLTADAQAALRDAPPPEALVAPFFAPGETGAFLNRLMRINVRLKGADHILTKVSALTQACGLVGRSPLFDRRVVEASFAIPPVFKLAGASEKAILKEAVADLLPPEILLRPKSGMLVPVRGWFRGPLRGWARGLLLDRRARIRPWICQNVVREWLDGRGDLWPRYGIKLWLLLTLEVWLRVHGD